MATIIGNNVDVTFQNIINALNPTFQNSPEYGPHLFDDLKNDDFLVIPDVNHLNLFGVIQASTFSFDSNTIKALNGQNTMYGTMGNLNLETSLLKGGGLIGENFFHFDPNTIQGGQSSGNTVFGNMDLLSLTASDAYFNVIGNTGSGLNNVFDVGHNNLTVGNGVENEMYGSFRAIILHAENIGIIGGLFANGGNDFVAHSNTLTTGNGDTNLLGGVANEMTLVAENRGVIGSFSVGDPDLLANSFHFEANNLTCGNGKDVALIGAIVHFNISATEFGSIGFEGTNVFDFDSNTFNVGNGDNHLIVGQVQALTISADTGGMIGSTFDQNPGGYEGRNSLHFAGNDISSGNGKNAIVYGNIETILFSTLHGSLEAHTTIQFGDNTLHADGKDATLVGNFDHIDFDISNTSLFQDNTIHLGNNTLTAADSNSTLYGSFVNGDGLAEFATQTPQLVLNGDLTYTVYNVPGGQIATLPFDLSTLQPLPGVTQIGSGQMSTTQNVTDFALTFLTQDQLDGTAPFAMKLSGSITITDPGTYVFYTLSDDNSALYVDGSQVILANVNQPATYLYGMANLAIGTHSIDVLYLENKLQYTLSFGLAGQDDNQVFLGNNTLIAGKGDAIMWGYGQGDLAFGDNPNISYGENTFQFDLNKGFGDIKVEDMNVGHLANAANQYDILDFKNTGGSTPAVVDSHIQSFTNDGLGGTLITFLQNLGTIDFVNIPFLNQHSVLDITPHVVVS
jgi:hypothetical protein